MAILKDFLRKVSDFIRPSDPLVVVGMGIVSPYGIGEERFWQGLKEGRSGIGPITLFDASEHPNKVAAEVPDWAIIRKTLLTSEEIRRQGRPAQFAAAASMLAFNDAKIPAFDPKRVDVIIGAGEGDLGAWEDELKRNRHGLDGYAMYVDPELPQKTMLVAPCHAVALKHKLEGFVAAVSSACTSVTASVIAGAARLNSGAADFVVVGGVEAPINNFTITALCAQKFLSTETDPEKAVRPYDLHRKASVMGEGGALFIMTRRSHAEKLGLRIRCTVLGWSQVDENTGLKYLPDLTGRVWARNTRTAVGDAVDKIDYINGHGPGHWLIDYLETRQFRLVLGNRMDKIPLSSAKNYIGSGMGSAGALQLAQTVLSIEKGLIPATLGHTAADPRCKANVVTRLSRVRPRQALVNFRAMMNSVSSVRLGKGA